jgi:hypothetical protein
MADNGPILMEETGTREENLPAPLTAEEFEAQPEFAHFRTVMKRLLGVSKSALDRKVRRAKKRSPRAGNPNAPGRKAHNKDQEISK